MSIDLLPQGLCEQASLRYEVAAYQLMTQIRRAAVILICAMGDLI